VGVQRYATRRCGAAVAAWAMRRSDRRGGQHRAGAPLLIQFISTFLGTSRSTTLKSRAVDAH
jgi:hypothetical protein